MLREVSWAEDRSYRTGSENEPVQFFMDGLANCNDFQLLLGYFSSAAINLLSIGFATFISKGGKMRMVINHLLSEKDKEAVKKSEDIGIGNKIFDLSDAIALGEILDDYDKHFFECLAYLISEKRIQIKVIRPKTANGIAHYKEGVFFDGYNYVGYSGSCNFTYYGLSENKEKLNILLGWENVGSEKFIKNQLKIIDDYFNENEKDVEYLLTEEIEVAIKEKFGKKDINELIVQEELLLKRKMSLVKNNKLKETIIKLFQTIDEEKKLPKFPYEEGPREYQEIAFENWKNNNQQGLFAMATGTGKTITSLNCLLEIYKKTGYYKALILVPTITLVNQWENECKKFNFGIIVKVTSKSHWKSDFASILTRERLSQTKQVSYIVISTYASFVRESIFNELNKLPPKTLLISDECHNMGSQTLLKLLPKINCKRRIGLSATPERQFDEEANTKLFSFFNSENQYTYEYSMKEAIRNGVLCRYYYYPHLVSLNESEMKDYLDLSLKISKYYNSVSDSFKSNPILTALLLARKRIIHKAFNKISSFKHILKEQYEKNGCLKYTLVYVPEGNDENDYFENEHIFTQDEIEDDNDTAHLIDVYTRAVKDIDNRTTIVQFTSKTNYKESILNQFAIGEIDVLTSMKCLDEGVDVPRSELAIFCASTGNPRQFVQRRGRILRTHPQKQFAYIHDLVVIPLINSNSDNYRMEKSMLKKELERVNNFALLAENSSYTINTLLDTMNYYNLNLYHND